MLVDGIALVIEYWITACIYFFSSMILVILVPLNILVCSYNCLTHNLTYLDAQLPTTALRTYFQGNKEE